LSPALSTQVCGLPAETYQVVNSGAVGGGEADRRGAMAQEALRLMGRVEGGPTTQLSTPGSSGAAKAARMAA